MIMMRVRVAAAATVTTMKMMVTTVEVETTMATKLRITSRGTVGGFYEGIRLTGTQRLQTNFIRTSRTSVSTRPHLRSTPVVYDQIVAFRTEVTDVQRIRFDLEGFTLKYTRRRIAAGLLGPVESDSGSEDCHYLEDTGIKELPAMKLKESYHLKEPQQRCPSVLRGVPHFKTEDVKISHTIKHLFVAGKEEESCLQRVMSIYKEG